MKKWLISISTNMRKEDESKKWVCQQLVKYKFCYLS